VTAGEFPGVHAGHPRPAVAACTFTAAALPEGEPAALPEDPDVARWHRIARRRGIDATPEDLETFSRLWRVFPGKQSPDRALAAWCSPEVREARLDALDSGEDGTGFDLMLFAAHGEAAAPPERQVRCLHFWLEQARWRDSLPAYDGAQRVERDRVALLDGGGDYWCMTPAGGRSWHPGSRDPEAWRAALLAVAGESLPICAGRGAVLTAIEGATTPEDLEAAGREMCAVLDEQLGPFDIFAKTA
jgi:hypothetical protein